MMLATTRWLAQAHQGRRVLLRAPFAPRPYAAAPRRRPVASPARSISTAGDTRPTPQEQEAADAQSPRGESGTSTQKNEPPSWARGLRPLNPLGGPTPPPLVKDLPPFAASRHDDANFLNDVSVAFANSTQMTSVRQKEYWQCKLRISLGKHGQKTLKAQAPRQADAKRIVWLYFLAVMHAAGMPESTYRPPSSLSFSNESLSTVYHLCAAYAVVPHVQVHPCSKGQELVCIIKVKELGIAVTSGPRPSPSKAIAEAVSKFREAASRLSPVSHEARRLTFLLTGSNSDSTPEFTKWLKKECGFSLSVRTVKTGLPSMSYAAGTYELRGFPPTQLPPVEASSLEELPSLILVQALVSVCRAAPELLVQYSDRGGPKSPPGVLAALQNLLESYPTAQNSVVSNQTVKVGASDAAVSPGESMAQSKSLVIPVVKPARPTGLDVAQETYGMMQAISDLDIQTTRETEAPGVSRRRPRPWSHLTQAQKTAHSQRLSQAYTSYELDTSPAILKARAGLPVAAYKRELLELVDNNVYSIFIGATGSGKTTQVPHLIFEAWCRSGRGADCNIMCTQPRVIAATSVASRVKDEVGRTLRERVGFHIRNQSDIPVPGTAASLFALPVSFSSRSSTNQITFSTMFLT